MYIDYYRVSDSEVEADLWLQSRIHTEKLAGDLSEPALGFKQIVTSFRMSPTKYSFAFDPSALPADLAVIVDLNKYRENADLKKMHDEMGLKRVILRMGGPAQFVYDNWMLTEDPTYRKYYDDAKALGMTVGGYFIYSAGIDDSDYANSEILINFVNEVMDGGRYKPDWIIVDDEVDTWWQNGKKTTVTGVNQIKGLKYLFPKLWRYFHLVPMHYSGTWFMNKYKVDYMTWLDNVNNTYEGKTVMNWYAYYLSAIQNSNKVYTRRTDLLNDIPPYTSTAINAYLQFGSYSLYDLHQLTSNWITPFVTNSSGMPIGVDVSVTRKSEQLFFEDLLINVQPTDSIPPATPQALAVVDKSASHISINWLPSSDNVGTTGYTVYVDDNQLGATDVASYTINALPSTSYSIAVDAYDAAGNHSTKCAPISVITPANNATGCVKKIAKFG